MAESPFEICQRHIMDGLRRTLGSGKFSDLHIICGEHTIRVHKMIVCEMSMFFQKAIDFGGQESELSRVDLSNEDLETVQHMIDYMYQGYYWPCPSETLRWCDRYDPLKKHTPEGRKPLCLDYPCDHKECHQNCSMCEICMPESCKGGPDQLLLHSQMYEIGDRYVVKGLKELARQNFKIACDIFCRSEEFIDAAYHVFEATLPCDKGLRQIVRNTLVKHSELVIHEEFREFWELYVEEIDAMELRHWHSRGVSRTDISSQTTESAEMATDPEPWVRLYTTY